MLLAGDVAQHVGAVPPDHRRADRRGDVVVTRRDVRHERAQRVERRLVAQLLLLADVDLDQVQRNVPRPLDHHLNVPGPRPRRQLPQRLQLGELGAVVRIGERPGSQRVAQRQRDVVAAGDLQQPVEVLVERVLPVVGRHPVGVQRPAARHDPRHSTQGVFAQDPAVHGDVIDALLCLVLDHVEQIVGRQLLDARDVLHRLVDGDGPHRHRRRVDDRLADAVDVAAGREVHHGVGPVVHGVVQFIELAGDITGDGGVADVGVDLDAGHLADRHRVEPLGDVLDVGRDDEAPARDLVADQLGRELFALGDAVHLGGDGALAGAVHLSDAGHRDSLRRYEPDQVVRV